MSEAKESADPNQGAMKMTPAAEYGNFASSSESADETDVEVPRNQLDNEAWAAWRQIEATAEAHTVAREVLGDVGRLASRTDELADLATGIEIAYEETIEALAQLAESQQNESLKTRAIDRAGNLIKALEKTQDYADLTDELDYNREKLARAVQTANERLGSEDELTAEQFQQDQASKQTADELAVDMRRQQAEEGGLDVWQVQVKNIYYASRTASEVTINLEDSSKAASLLRGSLGQLVGADANTSRQGALDLQNYLGAPLTRQRVYRLRPKVLELTGELEYIHRLPERLSAAVERKRNMSE